MFSQKPKLIRLAASDGLTNIYKSGIKRLNTLGHLDQYMAQHSRIVKQSYCETV